MFPIKLLTILYIIFLENLQLNKAGENYGPSPFIGTYVEHI